MNFTDEEREKAEQRIKELTPTLDQDREWEYYYDQIKVIGNYCARCGKLQCPEGYTPTEEEKDKYCQCPKHGKDSDCDSETAKEVSKQTCNRAKDKCAGNIHHDILHKIEKLNYKPKDWKNDLKSFRARLVKIKKEATFSKRHRRFPNTQPGYRKQEELTLALAIDTSASVSDEYLVQFFTEIVKLHSMGVVIYIIECDTEAQEPYLFDPKMKIEVKGRGGTKYQPAIDKASVLEVDGLIYFGDMEIWEEDLKKPKFPVLWAMIPGSTKPANWGRSTIVEIKQNA